MGYSKIAKLPRTALWAAILAITSGCNLPISSAEDQVETQVAATLRVVQESTDTARALGTEIAATIMSENTLTPTLTGDQTESTPTPTQPTATPTPTFTPTATATTTATPTPAPVEVNLDTPSSGGGSVSGQHTGVLGVVLADANYGYSTGNGRLQVSAWIPTAGILEEPRATGWLERPFSVPSTLGPNVEFQASGDVDWRGVLAGNGVAGAGAEVSIVLKLLDGSRVIAQTAVHSKEVRESALSVGGLTDASNASPSLSATLVGGQSYSLRLEASCNATSGVVSASTHCIFGPSNFYPDGYVHWGGFTVVLIP